MAGFQFAHSGLLLDACCTINLYASGQMISILETIPIPVAVTQYVREVEVLHIAQGDSIERIDLEPLIAQGRLRVVGIDSEVEFNRFVNLAAKIDDGEAVTGVLAQEHTWAIATDDGRARRFFAEFAPDLQVVSTPELIKHWADILRPPPEMLRKTLQNIRKCARYEPNNSHALYAWWIAALGV